jgi:hypothetical protein
MLEKLLNNIFERRIMKNMRVLNKLLISYISLRNFYEYLFYML